MQKYTENLSNNQQLPDDELIRLLELGLTDQILTEADLIRLKELGLADDGLPETH